MHKILDTKIDRMLDGHAVIMSDAELDAANILHDGVELRSIFNPQRVGVRDKYLCWIGGDQCPNDYGSRYRVDFDHGRSSLYVWAMSQEDAEIIGTKRFARIMEHAPIGNCQAVKLAQWPIGYNSHPSPVNRFQ